MFFFPNSSREAALMGVLRGFNPLSEGVPGEQSSPGRHPETRLTSMMSGHLLSSLMILLS